MIEDLDRLRLAALAAGKRLETQVAPLSNGTRTKAQHELLTKLYDEDADIAAWYGAMMQAEHEYRRTFHG